MAADAGFGFEFDFDFDQGLNLPGAGTFSKLLLSDDEASPFSYPSSPPPPPTGTSLFSLDTPKMLCFGDGSSQITSQSLSSSSVSKSSSNASINSLTNGSKNNRKRNSTPPPEKEGSGTPKKIRSGCNAKAKKREKLGDRIATLQQLVSPYGKTDTASVLHETMGYIKFLQDQVKVLCSPYLKRLPCSSLPTTTTTTSHGESFESTQGLKSKGLCLVPVGGIADMGSGNGADLWSPLTSKTVANSTSANVATASYIC